MADIASGTLQVVQVVGSLLAIGSAAGRWLVSDDGKQAVAGVAEHRWKNKLLDTAVEMWTNHKVSTIGGTVTCFLGLHLLLVRLSISDLHGALESAAERATLVETARQQLQQQGAVDNRSLHSQQQQQQQQPLCAAPHVEVEAIERRIQDAREDAAASMKWLVVSGLATAGAVLVEDVVRLLVVVKQKK